MAVQKQKRAWASIAALAGWVAEESVAFSEDSPFLATVVPGAAGMVVITGENASGKSLLTRVMAAKAHTDSVLPVSISIRERSGSGTSEMSRMRQSIMFGDETDQSTGATSARVVGNGFKNLDREQGSVLLLDEPELGLSDGYAHALGEFIGTQAADVPATCAGVAVVTHSRSLVRGLLETSADTPTWVHVAVRDIDASTAATALTDWVASTEHRTVEDLLALPMDGLTRFRAVGKLLGQF